MQIVLSTPSATAGKDFIQALADVNDEIAYWSRVTNWLKKNSLQNVVPAALQSVQRILLSRDSIREGILRFLLSHPVARKLLQSSRVLDFWANVSL